MDLGFALAVRLIRFDDKNNFRLKVQFAVQKHSLREFFKMPDFAGFGAAGRAAADVPRYLERVVSRGHHEANHSHDHGSFIRVI